MGYLRIENIDISEIGGPVSFSIIEPISLPQGFNTCPIMLLGDHHNCFENVCESTKAIHTNTTLWFRLLDSIGTKEHPVQYYIESYFDEDLLTDPYYFREENIKRLLNSGEKTYMSYIMRYHPSCFAPKNSENFNCITSNINYIMSDLRLPTNYVNLKNTHKSILKIQSENILNNMVKLDYKKDASKEMIKRYFGKSTFNDRMIKELNDIRNYSYPNYESQLCFMLSSYDMIIFEKTKWINNFKINSKKLFRLFIYEKFDIIFDMIFDMSNPYLIKYSKVYNVMNNLNQINWCRKLFKDYFIYFCKNCLLDKDTLELIEFMIDNIESDRNIRTKYAIYSSRISSIDHVKDESLESSYNFKKKYYDTYYPNLCNLMADIILAPFNDMYMLFHSWNTKSSLNVYNAGFKHVKLLHDFLVQNLYKDSCIFYGKDFNENTDIHCIKFKEEIILPKSSNRQLNNIRYDAFGEKLYLEMLGGKIISIDDLKKNNYFQNFLQDYTFEEALTILKLNEVHGLVLA